MKRPLTIRQIRMSFNITLGVILVIFGAGLALLYLRYDNVLSGSPEVERREDLLSTFRSRDFQEALDRLEKRRDLPDPAESERLPFGEIPE